MSGLTGFLTSSGVDLSNIFLSNGGGTFTQAITTSSGIIGPSSTITYSQGMIGYTVLVTGNRTDGSISSNAIVSYDNAFTMPIGVYLVVACAANSYTSSGSLEYFNIGISTSSTGFSVAGFSMTSIGSCTLPTSGLIKGCVTNIIQNTTNNTYYLLEILSFSGVTVTTSSANSYVIYTRIA